jgi:ankyrin repeat protein
MRGKAWFLIATALVLATPVAGRGAEGDGALVDAVKQRDVRAVRTLVSKGDVNAAGPDGTTALHWAARSDDPEIVRLLIARGADVRATNRYGITPMWQAALNGNAQIIEALAEAGAPVDVTLASGETPLLVAARTGKVDAVRALVARGANVNLPENVFGQTPLMLAAAENHADVCRLLLSSGANVNTRTSLHKGKTFALSNPYTGGFTALMYAVRHGSKDATAVLLDAGANINEQDPDGISPLLLAVFNGHYDLAAMLVKRGADVNLVDEAGRGPLYQAIDMRRLEFIAGRPSPKWVDDLDALGLISLLLESGANVNAPLTKRQPMRKAASPSDTWLIEGTTPFLKAAKNADVPVLKILLEHKADPYAQAPKVQASALMFAAGVGWRELSSIAPESDALEAVKFLWERGGYDINAITSNSGQTALHGAASRGAASIIQFLVEKGANPHAKDKKGRTPLDEAGPVDEGMAGSHPPRPEAQALLRKVMEQSPNPTPAQQ